MSRINPFIGKKSVEERKATMMQSLMAPAIQNHSPNYHLPQPAVEVATQNRLITVTLDKLRPYEGNPRRTKNPAYDEIKASIKARGLDHAPNITQRPGDDYYIVADGGNTRLQALKELFTETQDPKFWSIECILKPWVGAANDPDAQINQLIGHLAENDIRGDLSFIEKALGVREVKALYEEKYQAFFSHRQLAEKLAENGYPISNQIIARMEQCLTYLYPHIPNILLSGLGKPQVEKILAIHRNASSAWALHKEEYEPLSDFDEIWMQTLSPYDEEPDNFSLPVFQDDLIGKISEAFGYQVAYDTLKIEIDLEERKLKRMIAKQPEIAQRALDSENRVQEIKAEEEEKLAKLAERQAKKEVLSAETSSISTSNAAVSSSDEESKPFMDEENGVTDEQENTELNLPSFDAIDTDNRAMMEAVLSHFEQSGMTPGVNPDDERSAQAVENGLEFAYCGRQPISHIWKIYPQRKHKLEAYSLALDIAEELGIEHLIEHVVKDPVDYSFRVLPLTESDNLTRSVHQLLTVLATENLLQQNLGTISLNVAHLLGSQTGDIVISDLLLVRLFRLIRVVRYLYSLPNEV